MKKYLIALAAAICAFAGPTVEGANAQAFYRGGPTFVDRLMGNGYGNYVNTGYPSYGGYPAYGNYNYRNPWGRNHCHRISGYGNYGNFGYGNAWHHHHRRW